MENWQADEGRGETAVPVSPDQIGSEARANGEREDSCFPVQRTTIGTCVKGFGSIFARLVIQSVSGMTTLTNTYTYTCTYTYIQSSSSNCVTLGTLKSKTYKILIKYLY